MAPSGRDDPDRALFADELRAMRKHAGLSRDELGERIGYSGSVIGNIEAQHRSPTKDQARRLDEAFSLPGTFARLEERLRGVPFSAGFRPFHPYEAEARTLRTFQHVLIPGLLQTEDYARALSLAYPDTTDEEVEERVTARLARQAILTREEPPPPKLWVLLDEAVLHREVGSAKVMHNQLMHLERMARRPNITVQVIPRTLPHPGLLGAFVIAEPDDSGAIVYLENADGGQTVEKADTVSRVTLMFDALRTEALPGSASLSLIEDVADKQWKEIAP
ncbi:MAG: helix-turn-helix transcriptional regulator [Streptosporangiaceae bacterium]|nr:helix-turn-helix transcriptional regulator [Streptosporangiaceae bacterium]MBV9854620.1 helix-turn-helix transcriptional regulator [Streptosporangiaceae bacterium]